MEATLQPGSVADTLAAFEQAVQARRAASVAEVALMVRLARVYEVDEEQLLEVAIAETYGYVGHDGTPPVGEFLVAHLATVLGCSTTSARFQLVDALDLVYRHPLLWEAVQDGRSEVWQAKVVAQTAAKAGLDAEGAAWVDRQCAVALRLQPMSKVLREVDRWVLQANPALAAERAEAKARDRHVSFGRIEDGHVSLFGQLDAGDGLAFDAVLDHTADVLAAAGHLGDHRQLRSTAVGVLSRAALGENPLPLEPKPPEAADGSTTTVQELQSLAAGSGTDDEFAVSDDDLPPFPFAHLLPDPDRREAHAVAATGEVDLTSMWPNVTGGSRRQVVLHVHLRPGLTSPVGTGMPAVGLTDHGASRAGATGQLGATGHSSGTVQSVAGSSAAAGGSTIADDPWTVASVDGWGEVLTDRLGHLFAGCDVTIRPVIDLTALDPVDGYQIPDRMRDAVCARNPVDVFPFGTKPSRACDLDHTVPYQPGISGQTRLDNLGPLSRYTHRVKTFGGWRVVQVLPGVFEWTSPFGWRYQVTPFGTLFLGRPPRAEEVRDAGTCSQCGAIRRTATSVSDGASEVLGGSSRPPGETLRLPTYDPPPDHTREAPPDTLDGWTNACDAWNQLRRHHWQPQLVEH